MPEEQSTHSESEANTQEPKANLEKNQASDSGETPTINVPTQAESTATPSDSSAKAEPIDTAKDSPQSTPKSPRPDEGKKAPQSTSPIPGRTRSKSTEAKPTSAGPKAGKGSKPTADSAQDAGVGGSKIEAALTQVVVIVGKVASSIFSPIGTKLKESSLYSKLEPVFKVTGFLWNRIIVPFGNLVIKPLWGLGLKLLRGRFPDALKPFSDRFLTIVILGFATLIYWLVSSLIPPSQPAVQKQPAPAPVAKAPAPAPKPAPVAQPTASPPPTPAAEAPVEEPPPPEPERKQIIEVQSQVAQVFDQYSQDIVQSVQANFQAERLVIKVSDRWFELSQSEQNHLGTDVLERSRKLDFPKLEIRDQTDQLLAREPVVGSNIIVLQRRMTPPELVTDSPA